MSAMTSSDGGELEIAPVPPDEVRRAIAAALAAPQPEEEAVSAWWHSGSVDFAEARP